MLDTQRYSRKRSKLLGPIHDFCVDCSCVLYIELRLCPSLSCPLYPYRSGKNPFRKRFVLSDDVRRRCGDFVRQMREDAKK